MTISKDRVRFTIPSMMLTRSTSADLLRQLIEDVFGECLGRADWNDITIICRPSQFARFLIERNNRGMQNSFKELKPELFQPTEQPVHIFDVSEYPNRPLRLTYSEP